MTARLQALFLPNDEYLLVVDNADDTGLMPEEFGIIREQTDAQSVLVFSDEILVLN